jgi:ribonuclease HII
MVGVDEVGRGCLAGPLLVVAARQLADLPKGTADSKILTRGRREELLDELTDVCKFGEGWVKPVEINHRGLAGAMRLGIKRALKQLSVSCQEEIIMDGPLNYFSPRYKQVKCLVDADAKVPIVSAASIYAKVKRDRYMIELAKRHPRFGFDSHVGYATRTHLDALNRYGYLKRVHRRFFSPVYALDQADLWRVQA